ncbi:MAG: HIT family protein [Chlamydiia bacterium]|nr:HIT family protein [Chlamydiia bacterium]
MEEISFPKSGLTEYAVEVDATDYNTMQKVVALWQQTGLSESYMMLQIDRNRVQMVPYTKTTSLVGRLWQQLQVLYRFTFGGWKLTSERVQQLKDYYSQIANQEVTEKVKVCARCAFCAPRVIDSQLVFEGKYVQILYNYAPIGLGGERLHFLIVTKRHCPTFSLLTQEEYEEANQLSLFLQEKVETPVRKMFSYHKTGEDAGQSVPHWHLHVVMTENAAQEWWGKLTVLRNILFGSFQLSAEMLEKQRQKYYTLLNSGL